MVLMRMADQECSRVALVERFRQQTRRTLRRIEWSPGVQDQPLVTRVFDLDAASADLLRTAMDREARTHR
jgi:hypothetical protein